MSVFSIPVTLGIDEEKIAKEIESDARKQVLTAIIERIEDAIYDHDYYGRRTKSTKPLKDIIAAEVKKVITAKEDVIIEAAAKHLADKISRSKVMKDKVGELLEEYEDAGDEKDE